MFSRCRVVGCSRPARAGTQDGLDTRFCRSHADHYSRHGSPYKRSYTAKELAPHVEAFRLRGLSPDARAQAAWARLRKAQIDPAAVVAAWIAVELAIAADPQPETKLEFKQVQAAKLVHKMASGTHKRWEAGVGGVQEMHVYPRSRGRVLRHIGSQAQRAVELLTAYHRMSRLDTPEA